MSTTGKKREASVCCKPNYHFSSQFFWQSNLKQRFSVMMQYERDKKYEIGIYLVIFALFFLSYGIVLQPEYKMPEVDLSFIYDTDYVIEQRVVDICFILIMSR